MAFSLPVPEPWCSQGWKVKIRDRERLEPPHVTILFKTRAWRLDLRTSDFIDRDPPSSEVPAGVRSVINEHRATLRRQWDAMYPDNPVAGEEGDHE